MKMPMTRIITDRGDDPERARYRRAEPAQSAHDLAAELLDPGSALDDSEAVAPGEDPVGLGGDDLAKPLGLAGQLGAGEIEDPDDEGDGGDRHDGEAPAAADRKHPAEQPGAAVEHRGEHDPGEDEEQGLGEEDQGRDGEGEAEPDAGPLQLLADERVAHLGGAGLLDMAVMLIGSDDARAMAGASECRPTEGVPPSPLTAPCPPAAAARFRRGRRAWR